MLDLLYELMSIGGVRDKVVEYLAFVSLAQEPDKGEFGERHHILPKKPFVNFSSKKMYPQNQKRLYANDHAKAHYLLCQAVPTCASFAYALNQMVGGLPGCIDKASTVYSKAKELRSEDARKLRLGCKQSMITIARRVRKTTGQKRTTEQRERMSLSMRGVKRKRPKSEAVRLASSLAAKGRKKSTETRERMRSAWISAGAPKRNKLTGEIARIRSDDPRVHSPDWEGLTKGKIQAFCVVTKQRTLLNKDDPRLVDGSFVTKRFLEFESKELDKGDIDLETAESEPVEVLA